MFPNHQFLTHFKKITSQLTTFLFHRLKRNTCSDKHADAVVVFDQVSSNWTWKIKISQWAVICLVNYKSDFKLLLKFFFLHTGGLHHRWPALMETKITSKQSFSHREHLILERQTQIDMVLKWFSRLMLHVKIIFIIYRNSSTLVTYMELFIWKQKWWQQLQHFQ